eukprot:TRINITY_DN5141_c0_g1_i1.p1 TRINITY_DN5141_c0_g1~~TRINITY_DN5141_c0_g1_i1.p1  ORF type:complete len:240 (+),score=73.06 TRINITY_DN5141_c0_g1_i1:94-813(+)
MKPRVPKKMEHFNMADFQVKKPKKKAVSPQEREKKEVAMIVKGLLRKEMVLKRVKKQRQMNAKRAAKEKKKKNEKKQKKSAKPKPSPKEEPAKTKKLAKKLAKPKPSPKEEPAKAKPKRSRKEEPAKAPMPKRRCLEATPSAGRRGTGYKWQFVENDKTWRDYAEDASAVVEQHFHEWEAEGKRSDIVVRAVKSGDWSYDVCFEKLKQTNADHHNHTERNIRRVPQVSSPRKESATKKK